MSDSAAGKMLNERVIPAIELLARNCPMRLGDILQHGVLSQSAVSVDTLCSNLASSDRVFDQLRVKYVAFLESE